MIIKYLAVDSNIELADSEAVAWERHCIGMDRTDNMTDAIKKLLISDSYLYIGINDDVIDFLPLLSTMRSVTTRQSL